MDVSVVITTFNGGPSLRQTLRALRRQTYRRFEVVLINGLSPENIETTLAEFGADVRVETCPEATLAKARNVGIALAAGEVIAFLGDDAIPDPRWLEELIAGYDPDQVAGVGGLVHDSTSHATPFAGPAAVCDRLGQARENVQPPYWGYSLPQPDRILQLPAANVSFRRRTLAEVGGFDEEIEASFEAADLCLRLVDRGYPLRLRPGAVVYHTPSLQPVHQPFAAVKSRLYFMLRAQASGVSFETIVADCDRFAAGLAVDQGFAEDVDLGRWLGIARGRHGVRQLATIPPPRPEQFAAFPTWHAGADALTVCIVAPEESPEEGGEVGRFLWELARGFADRGHESHFLTPAPDRTRIAFADGVWLHRLAPEREGPWCTPDLPPALKESLARAAAVHREVRRIHASCFVDLVSVPPGGEGIYCLFDDDLTCVLALPTPRTAVREHCPSPVPVAEQCALLALEELTLRAARHVHSIPDETLPGAGVNGGGTTERAVERALRAYADLVARRKAA